MDWEFTPGKPHPGRPAGEKLTPAGVVKRPALPPTPARDLFKAAADAQDWRPGLERQLVDFWLKVCEVWAQYYPSPQLDARWDAIFCTIDVLYGYARAQVGLGRKLVFPAGAAKVITVFVKLPLVERLRKALPDSDVDEAAWQKGYDDIEDRLVKALATAAALEPAKSRLAELRAWHPFELLVMHAEIPESTRPLPVPTQA